MIGTTMTMTTEGNTVLRSCVLFDVIDVMDLRTIRRAAKGAAIMVTLTNPALEGLSKGGWVGQERRSAVPRRVSRSRELRPALRFVARRGAVAGAAQFVRLMEDGLAALCARNFHPSLMAKRPALDRTVAPLAPVQSSGTWAECLSTDRTGAQFDGRTMGRMVALGGAEACILLAVAKFHPAGLTYVRRTVSAQERVPTTPRAEPPVVLRHLAWVRSKRLPATFANAFHTSIIRPARQKAERPEKSYL
jgi:hypothetical protein